MTDKLENVRHHREESEAAEAPVEVTDQTMEKVVGGINVVAMPKDKADNTRLNKDDDILLPEI